MIKLNMNQNLQGFFIWAVFTFSSLGAWANHVNQCWTAINPPAQIKDFPTTICIETIEDVKVDTMKPRAVIVGTPFKGEYQLTLVSEARGHYVAQLNLFNYTNSEGTCEKVESLDMSLELNVTLEGEILNHHDLKPKAVFSHQNDSCHSPKNVTPIEYQVSSTIE